METSDTKEGGTCCADSARTLDWLDRDQVQNGKKVYRFCARVRDVICSLLALTVLSPVLLAVALAIWIDSPGASPVFVQERVGRDGKIFRLYKFRSMVPHAEEKLEEILHHNEMDGPVFKIKGDPRITRVGSLIRKTGIDELPQLVNILKGEMSIVGPRPPLPREVAQYTPYEMQRLYVAPGLTCYWQIQPNRNKMSFAQWVELDLQYIRDRSFWLDWVLICKTAVSIFRMDGQ